MGRIRISASVKPTIAKVTKQYAIFNGVSFSESVEILAGLSGLEWWAKLSNKQKKELDETYYNNAVKK
jgi:hypothetical protein